MNEPRLDINTWEIDNERLVGEITDAGQIETFENFVIDDLMANRPDLLGRLDDLPDPELHLGLNWSLSRGVLYDTDISELGGQPVPADGSYYVPHDNPTAFILVSTLIRFNYLQNRPPITGNLPTGLISVTNP